MISITMTTAPEMQKRIALNVRARRLSQNFSQQTLADKSGVSYGVVKKFERTGNISLGSLLKLAIALGAMDQFSELFAPLQPEEALSLDALMEHGTRKRGRK